MLRSLLTLLTGVTDDRCTDRATIGTCVWNVRHQSTTTPSTIISSATNADWKAVLESISLTVGDEPFQMMRPQNVNVC